MAYESCIAIDKEKAATNRMDLREDQTYGSSDIIRFRSKLSVEMIAGDGEGISDIREMPYFQD